MTPDRALDEWSAAFPETGETMPVLFVGHGNPMNAIEDNATAARGLGPEEPCRCPACSGFGRRGSR